MQTEMYKDIELTMSSSEEVYIDELWFYII